ncbi:MAG: hypothetical protein R2699_05540 [Acidimicrobiales bacterium]
MPHAGRRRSPTCCATSPRSSPPSPCAAAGATPVTGTLRSVGADVITLSCDGRTVVVPLANVDEVAVDELVL